MLASRKRFTGAVALAVVASGLLLLPAGPAQASVSAKIATFPYTQNWSGLTATSTWADFPGVEGFSAGTTIATANQPNTTNVGTLTAEGTLASSLVVRTGTAAPNADTNGGVLAYPNVADKTVALSATASITTPLLAFHLDTTGKSGLGVSYDVQDLDNSTDDQPTRVALQYRVGTSGAYTNVPGAYVTDATTVSNPTVGVTAVTATLPAAVDNQADVYLRVMTLDNATGSNEHIGIDNIQITTGAGEPEPTPLTATSPGAKTGTVGQAVTGFTLAATGGTAPYQWTATGMPPGVSVAADGAVSGTPTTAGTYTVTATATDSAGTPATDDVEFTFTIAEAPVAKTIAEIQGTDERSPYAPATGTGQGTQTLTTTGVVTGMYKDASFANSGFDGFTIQTGGTGASVGAASNGLFVYYGANTISNDIAIGDSVQVTGKVSEFFGLTELNIAASGVVELGSALDPVTPLETAYPTTAAAREPLESTLIEPTGTFTVSNAYSTNQYGEIGLATGTSPLRQPTEFADATDDLALQAIRDENAERAVTLDDGTGVNYLSNQTTKAQPVPYLTGADGNANPAPPRVGAEVTLHSPVVLDYRNDTWKLQPTSPVYLNGADVATFEDTRTGDLHPANVGGDLTIATFNVLNYFNTTGEAYVAAGPAQNPPVNTQCTYYTDRASNRIGNNTCGVVTDGVNAGNGPRGAATAASLTRQETKLANTIEALNADIIALEEIENSIKLPGETNRDDAVSNLVQILNTKAGETKWAYVKSPGEALTSGNIAEQDLIRPAFIYQVDDVATVGKSDILFGTTQFANAREPLAQVFKAKGAPDEDGFAVIVNHFKSKGDNASPNPPATGDNANHAEVGAFNGDRKRQAARLLTFANSFAASREVSAVFLAGDFNSYTKEEPITILEGGGYETIESDTAGEESYSYDGLSGSLDHVLGNAAAVAMVTGADIWEINANEAASFMYSRYNYNVTDFWQPTLPFGTSDHNPEVIGIDVPDIVATPAKEIQVIGTNDFHGRLLPDAGNAAGAAPFATAVKELKTENPNSIFVAAGDLVGASTFESFIQDDNPTIDALNAMGLEVSAAGNHEFDRGYADFVGRIQDRADWEYIAANVEEPEGQPDKLAKTFTKTIDGVQVGFVGAVTEDLPALVNPSGIEGVTVTDIVDATNAAATTLKADGADIVVLLVHEGSSSTDCSAPSFNDPATVWGNIVQNTSPKVDAIISGHTHLAYNCRYTVPQWVTDGRAVTKRPVVSAGQYGTNLNQLVFKIDDGTGNLIGISQDVIATAGVGYAADPTVQGIVDDAVEFADEAGAAVLGKMSAPFKRASYLASGNPTENRGGESTLNNQVAEVQRWATDADVAFMNPGGLRADMAGTVNGGARDLTYRQAADVQPFANTLVKLTLTGAQLEKVLEEQWQRNAQGGVPSRPFLRLGVSKGLTYTYVETPETVNAPNSAPVNTFKGEITGMWLDGEPVSPAGTYTVAVNSFLGGGGDNFWELANGTGKVDTGKVDLEAMVDYMKQYESTPLAVDYSQRGVEVTFPGDAPEAYAPGGTVAFSVASWAMSADGDATDAQIQVKLGDEVLGTAPVTVTQSTTPYDNIGTAAVSVQLPAGVTDGTKTLTLVGATTGTEVPVDVTVDDGIQEIQILGTNDFHGRLQNDTTAATAGAAVLAGAVKQLRAENPETVFAAAGDLIGASTFESFIAKDKPTIDSLNEAGLEVSAAGNHEFDQGYNDLVNRVMKPYDADTNPNGGASWKYIAANLRLKSDNSHALAPTFTKTFGDVKVGFVGAVTEHLPELVSPGGISQLDVTDVVDEVNASANDLKADGADVIVLLVHEGAAGTACDPMDDDPTSDFGSIITGVNDKVDAIVSGHTHLAYNCSFPVAGWAGRPVTERPVVSAGQYGMALNQLVFSVDSATGQVQAKTQALLNLKSCSAAACGGSGQPAWTANYPVDSATKTIVDAAVANAAVLGAQPLGEIGGAFNRAKLANGTTENRGGESTLGNLVAEVQRWNTRNEESGSAQIAFMNPGGLRADMVGTGSAAFPRTLTYRQAADVQPFANTLVNEKLTGAQIKTVLEQQWQPDGASRPFLKLGISKGFTYTYDDTLPKGSRITGMWLDGEEIVPATKYSVTVNSFLSTGGDNFTELNNGTNKQDTGKTDLEGMVEYMAAFGDETPVPVDSSQRAVGVSFPADAPDAYSPGDHVLLGVSSWSMTGPGDVKDTEVTVKLGDTTIGTAPVTTTLQTALPGFDQVGTASVDVVLPDGTPEGPATLTLVGATTGTEVPVDITVDDGIQEIQILGTNDFHGRIQNDATSASAGAAVLSGAVKQLRAENPETVFAAAGDLIGASTFESFIAKDKPTIDSLNEAGLEVSAAGNHEFDQGYNDLVNRVMKPYDADTNPYGGASWDYIAANLRLKSDNTHALAPTFTKTFGDVQVGFVGAVTEHLPELVSPGGISQLDVTDIVTEVNASANDLKADGADVIVLLVHEGAAGTNCTTMDDDPTSDFGSIIAGVNDKVDAIVSGHTHLAYNCSFPVAGWSDRPVKERPVVSAGQYGYNLNQLVFSVDSATGQVQAKTQALLNLKSCSAAACGGSGQPAWTANYPVDSATKTIVDAAVANAAVLGAQPLGQIGGAFNRAKLADGTTENRGGESTLGNLVAEVQRWNTRNEESGSAQIAFMNPGGLRADLVGTGSAAFPRTLTYRQAADVQPFANTLVNEKLTGAQIKTVLEQQWQPDGASRPFLKLGISKGFTYTYDSTKAKGSRITGMWLDGEEIVPETKYSVTVNSFLSTGGDNFLELNNGTNKQDTGKTDLQGMVEYMAAFGDETPVPVDSSQRAVGVTFPGDAPASYQPGDDVAFSLASLSMTGPGDKTDPEVTVRLNGEPLETFDVTTTRQTALPGFDEVGTAQVVVSLPPGISAGTKTLYVRGGETGTEVPVKIVVSTTYEISAGDDQAITWGDATSIPVSVTGNDGVATGTVRLFQGETQIGAEVPLDDTGHASIPVPAKSVEPGERTLRVEYDGNYPSGSDTVTLTVAKATTSVSAGDATLTYGSTGTVTVTLGDPTATGTVQVRDGDDVLASADVSEGVATVTLPAESLEPGEHTLTARYGGDSHFEADTDVFTATVEKITPTVSAGNVSLTYGEASTVTVTVDPTATGTVQVRNGATVLGSAPVTDGVATVTLPAGSVEPGVTDLTAAYSGDDHFKAGTDTFTATVAKAAATVSAGNVSLTYGKAGTVTVDVGPSGATGTVQLFDGAKKVGTATAVSAAGVAKVTLPARSLKPGSHTLTAAYSGDDHVSSGSDTFTVSVAKAASSTKASASPTTAKVKKTKVTLKISVSGPTGVVGTGKVRVSIPGQGTKTVTLRAGKATLKLAKFTSTGTKTIRITYAGDDYLKSSSDTVKVKVKK